MIFQYLLIIRHGTWVHYRFDCNDDRYTKQLIIHEDLSFVLTLYYYDDEGELINWRKLTFAGNLEIIDINTYSVQLDTDSKILYEHILVNPLDFATKTPGDDIYITFMRQGKHAILYNHGNEYISEDDQKLFLTIIC